jgi:hypothetical protein
VYHAGKCDPEEKPPVPSLYIKVKCRKSNHQSKTLSHSIECLQIACVKEDEKEYPKRIRKR